MKLSRTASLLILSLCAGCGSRTVTESSAPPTTAFAAEPAKPAAKADAAKPVAAELADWKKTQAIIAKHKGKIVVLDFWSTWCEPCVKEFPGLVDVQKNHADDVVCISLNCNYIGSGSPDDEKADIVSFLTKQKAAGVTNLICSEADDNLYKKVGIASVPVTQVYGRDGKLAKQFDNSKEEYGKEGFTYKQHIAPYVKQLAAER